MNKYFILAALAACVFSTAAAPVVAQNDVAWKSLGTNENDSMPIGNGDLGANVWTEQNGDVVLLISKGDAWSENGQLLKLGRVRIKLAPSPLAGASDFTQKLKLENGSIEISAGRNLIRIRLDDLGINVDAKTESAVEFTAITELWRTNSYHLNQRAVAQDGFFEFGNDSDGLTFDPDVVFSESDGRVSWCHFNARSIYPLVFQKEHLEDLLPKYPDPLLRRAFGVVMTGEGLTHANAGTLKSKQPGRMFSLRLTGFLTRANSPEDWHKLAVKHSAERDTPKSMDAWWEEFWNRSWIRISGSPQAEKISQSYAMQRYMTACAGRGAQPIKFNGSIFTVGHDLPPGVSSSEKNWDPDYRTWGACYWNQNTRMLYWPLDASGDFDLLRPWFRMYVDDIPLVKDRTRAYFHHDGGAFIETIYFWGLPNLNDFGWNNPGPELESEWMRYHVQGGLEVLGQMLDYYDYTGDQKFLQQSLLPFADTVVTYYDQHWKRGEDGKILFAPAQSIETYQKTAVNPTPDIAGLLSALPRLLAIRDRSALWPEETSLWSRVLRDLPALPKGKTAKGKLPPEGIGDPDGVPTILPALKYDSTRNAENPELYAVFPYRLFGVGKPELDLAVNAYKARLFHMSHCWGQDSIEAALLGLKEDARKGVTEEFTFYGNQRFPWFWRKADWTPDMDDGGAGMEALQLMLMQCDGKRVILLPAWPRDWTADFKLHAPYQTTVEGHVENGKVSSLKVLPKSRAADVEIIDDGRLHEFEK